jgi:hypothetical protein
MLELRESETARALLRNTEVMQALKVSDWERYRRIEDLLARTYFDARDVRSRHATPAFTAWPARSPLRVARAPPTMLWRASRTVQAYGDATKERRRSQLASCASSR